LDYKDDGQRRILAIDITREGFDWALAHGCPSHPDPSTTKEQWLSRKNSSPVRIQWDPERNLLLEPLPYRSIQIGLGKDAVNRYVNHWIRQITDITNLAHSIHALVTENKLDHATAMLPSEKIYPYPR